MMKYLILGNCEFYKSQSLAKSARSPWGSLWWGTQSPYFRCM